MFAKNSRKSALIVVLAIGVLVGSGLCTIQNCVYSYIDYNKAMEICRECKEQYCVESIKQGSCQKCPTGCKTCSCQDNTCDTCVGGYFLKETSCSSCPYGCDTCTDVSSCSKCKSGFRLIKDGTCISCPKNCAVCSNDISCDKCDLNYVKTNSNIADSICQRSDTNIVVIEGGEYAAAFIFLICCLPCIVVGLIVYFCCCKKTPAPSPYLDQNNSLGYAYSQPGNYAAPNQPQGYQGQYYAAPRTPFDDHSTSHPQTATTNPFN